MDNIDYIDVNSDMIQHLFDGSLIIIVTATELETIQTHKKIAPLLGYNKIIRFFEGSLTYYFGSLGCYKIAHVQCAMGSISRASSIITVTNALFRLKSKIVVMIGIAFGVDEAKQKIGDVLISESVIPYNIKRVGKDNIIHRGIETPASILLVNRFKNIRTWEFLTNGDSKANVFFTRLLSGEELIDNIEYRNILMKEYPDSGGGEMEGAGISTACGDKIDWILVKGICDFANGNKGENKLRNQEIAIESALSICLELFNTPYAFKDLNIVSNVEIGDSVLVENLPGNDVLFEYYDKTKHQYYIERECDKLFNQLFKQYGIWLYGPSGCGKSNLIVRNLLSAGKDFVQINLSPCIGQDIESLFIEIYVDLASKIGVTSPLQPNTFNDCSRALIDILSKNFKDKELTIFIEEIPISGDKDQKAFAEKLFSLVISKTFADGLNKVKFVLSSINNPTTYISVPQHKIHQHLKFSSMEYWDDNEINLLIDLIETNIQFSLNSILRSGLIKSAAGSPRFIKKYYRSIYTLSKTDDKSLINLLKETERELNNTLYA
jgi:nucleoside phosphorylase